MERPDFITFTGVDERTNMEECLNLSKEYPVEFGFLYSESNNANRYTGIDNFFKERKRLNTSVHVCGSAARNLMIEPRLSAVISVADRIQINLTNKHYDKKALATLASLKPVIVQYRNTKKWVPPVKGTNFLLDCSGGRGIEISEVPEDPLDYFVGYAGGLKPKNVKAFLKKLPKHKAGFWIDMESGVRTNDWFDLEKCRKVCEEVYG